MPVNHVSNILTLVYLFGYNFLCLGQVSLHDHHGREMRSKTEQVAKSCMAGYRGFDAPILERGSSHRALDPIPRPSSHREVPESFGLGSGMSIFKKVSKNRSNSMIDSSLSSRQLGRKLVVKSKGRPQISEHTASLQQASGAPASSRSRGR
jgi:hypothetical protein